MKAIKLILFDLDDTLWPTRPVLEAAERASYQWLQQRAPLITGQYTLRDMFKRRVALLRGSEIPEHNVSEMRRMAYRLLAEECGYDGDESARIAEDTFAHFFEHRQKVQCFPGVEESLAALSEKYMLGALSNGNASLAHIPVGRHFAFHVACENLSQGKPHPVAFEAAITKAGEVSNTDVSAEQTIHVGDDLQRDVAGARNAGITAVWLDWKSEDLEGIDVNPEPARDGYHARISSMDDLRETIKLLAAGV